MMWKLLGIFNVPIVAVFKSILNELILAHIIVLV